MFKRIVKIAGAGLMLFCVMPAHASPIGVYGKLPIMTYWGENSKKDNVVVSLGGAYQFNRFRAWETTGSVLTSIKGSSDKETILYAVTFIDKQLIPLKYYFNLYTQWGLSYKSKLGLHAPFFGLGASYYYNRNVHFDCSWRNYSLCKELRNKGYDASRQNSFNLGFGWYIR